MNKICSGWESGRVPCYGTIIYQVIWYLTHMFNVCDAVGTCLLPGHINPHCNKWCHRMWLYFRPIHPQIFSPPWHCACFHVDYLPVYMALLIKLHKHYSEMLYKNASVDLIDGCLMLNRCNWYCSVHMYCSTCSLHLSIQVLVWKEQIKIKIYAACA